MSRTVEDRHLNL